MKVEQQVGGTQAQEDARIGAPRQITIDTDTYTLRVHDGVTPGGVKYLPEALMTAYSSFLFTGVENHGVPGPLPAAGTIQNKLNHLNATGDYQLPLLAGFTTGRPMLFRAEAEGVTLSVTDGQIRDGGADASLINIGDKEVVTITRLSETVFIVTNRYTGV